MLDYIIAGGWVMVPILLCSIIALTIVGERIWALQRRIVMPPQAMEQVIHAVKSNSLSPSRLQALHHASPMEQILASAVSRLSEDRETIMASVEESGRHVIHELERYLNGLGTIAAITPLLGLLGTVIGMVKVFTTITLQGVGDANALAGGISESLITTTAGLMVAIPTLMAHRYFSRRIDGLAIDLEQCTRYFLEHLKKSKNDVEDAL